MATVIYGKQRLNHVHHRTSTELFSQGIIEYSLIGLIPLGIEDSDCIKCKLIIHAANSSI
jgi:hypothetical protein